MEDYFPFGMVKFQGRTVKLRVVLNVKLSAVAPQCTSEALCSTSSGPDWSNRLFCCLKQKTGRDKQQKQHSIEQRQLKKTLAAIPLKPDWFISDEILLF